MTWRQRFSGAVQRVPDHHRKGDTFWHGVAALAALAVALLTAYSGQVSHVTNWAMVATYAVCFGTIFGPPVFVKVVSLMRQQGAPNADPHA